MFRHLCCRSACSARLRLPHSEEKAPSGGRLSPAVEGAVYVANAGVPTPHFTPVNGAGPQIPRPIGPDRRAGGTSFGFPERARWAPDGRTVAAQLDSRLWALSVDGSRPAVALTPTLAQGVGQAVWVDGGAVVAFIDDSWAGGNLYAARSDGSDAPALVPLLDEGTRVTDVVTVAPDDRSVIVQALTAQDHNLLSVPIDGEPAVPITTPDDAIETWVGYVESASR